MSRGRDGLREASLWSEYLQREPVATRGQPAQGSEERAGCGEDGRKAVFLGTFMGSSDEVLSRSLPGQLGFSRLP